ncbi:hypothetical protein ES703_36244 [subsurface metagenome]
MAEMIPDQQGRIVVVEAAPAGPGVDWTHTLPLRVRWRLRTIQATLVAGPDVVDRIPELTITQNGHEIIRITVSQSLAANLTFIYGWMEGERALAVTGQTSRVTALPRQLHLNNQAIIACVTVGLTLTDQWNDVIISAEEWMEPLA